MSFNKSLCMVLGVLAVSSVMAFEQSFEGEGIVVGNALELAGWGGYGTYSNTVDQSSLPAGTPIATTHAKHLAVDGWVTNTLEGTSGDARLDMLVKVARPDEELSGMSDTDAKFAMAIDTNGLLKCWMNDTWVALSSTAFTEGQWIRVAVIYDNTGKRCKVSVDGNACVTTAGYKAATGEETNGPWYPVIRSTSAISSLKVVGTTALDDIKVAYGTTTPTYNDASGNPITVAKAPASGENINIPLTWFDENNVATSATTAPDNSGMTIADKYQTGMDPNNDEAFALKSMSMSTDGSTVTATITVPACNPPGGAVVKVQKSADKNTWTDGDTLDPNETSASVTLESGNVTYFRMVLEK